MDANEFNGQISEMLQDAGKVTYTDSEMIGWINDGIRATILLRPDSTAVSKEIQINPGASPGNGPFALPSGDLRLIGVVRNAGVGGGSIGRAIVGPKTHEAMDTVDPLWHQASPLASNEVYEYVWEDTNPREFFTYPQVPAGGIYLLVRAAVLPTGFPLTQGADPIPLVDTYLPPLYDYCLHRLWGRDSDRSPNWQRSQYHRQAFFDWYGLKVRSDAAISPKRTEYAG